MPAFQVLYSRHDAAVGHYKRYSKRVLRSELESAGFLVERFFHWNLPGFFGWLLVAKLFGCDPTSAAGPLLNSFYNVWLSLEDRVHFPLGTLFAKARKVA